jgi:hypothetical protein
VFLLPFQAGQDRLDEKIAPLLPKPEEERWLKIPWRADFAAARAEANRGGKPLFLWLMDGNPLGCN